MKLVNVNASRTSDLYQWRCNHRGYGNKHDIRLSIRHGSWFSQSNMTLEEILEFTYWWCCGFTQDQIALQLKTSPRTNVDWCNFCRETCEMILLHDSENGAKIGGDGIIVEIDEYKFVNRKCGKEDQSTSGWVFGGLERQQPDKCFMIVVPDRTANTLVSLIEKHVEKGSVIISDCWKAYDRLGEIGYTHLTVNHSVNFVDPISGAHTNTIGGMWQKAKYGIHMPRFSIKEKHLSSYLGTFLWRQKHKDQDLFICFLRAASELYNGNCGRQGCPHCH